MAGYTSRILLTLTIPSIFGFLSILWFFKKKSTKSNSPGKSIEPLTHSDHYQYCNPMRLTNQETDSNDNSVIVETNQSDMQLKETETVSEKQSQNCNGSAHSVAKIKAKISKAKVSENGNTCHITEPIVNGCSKDNTPLSDNGESEVTNRIQTLSLKNELIVKEECTIQVIQQQCPDMEARNDTDIVINGPDEAHDLEIPQLITNDKEDTYKQVDSVCKGNTHCEIAKEQCDTNGQHLPADSSAADSDSSTIESDSSIELINDSTIQVLQPNSKQNLPDEGYGTAEGRTDDDSPNEVKYCESVDSLDSNSGPNELQLVLENHLYYMVYEFEILPENCGRLIGKSGRHVNFIKKQTNAEILIKRHPYLNNQRLCSVTGTETEINAALKLIRKRFPIENFPTVTLAQINSLPFELQCPETLKLPLPDGVPFEGMLCATVNAGHFFLQQPTHPTFHSLLPLTSTMTALYSQVEAPSIEHVSKGNVCAANLASGWFRAEVDEVFEEANECRLKFLDYGGYAVVPRSSIRQIKYEYMLVPFQASECYLGSVAPIDDNGWSKEVTAAFEEMAQGQILQGCIVGYAENRVPFVHLYKITGATSVFINQELVQAGLAKWANA